MKRAERAGGNVLCSIMGSVGYQSLSSIYLLKSRCTGGMLLTASLFPPAVILELVFVFTPVSPGESKSIPDSLPLVSLLR